MATRKPKRNNPRALVDVRNSESPFYTVDQFCRRHPVFTPSSLRWMIFQSAQNGLGKSGALLRNGRAIIIDEPAFLAWFRKKRVT